MTSDRQMKAELDELSLMAREACVSLREVIWVTDQHQVSLASLVKRLIERAERVLGRVQLEISQPDGFPEFVVSLSFKRHVVMLFKEALHNCVRHAGARHVWIDFAVSSERFSLSVRDDGCGFDPEATSEGCGMDHLRDRAREMGGELFVQSQVGHGTEISLVVPLANLNIEPSTPYVTSN